MSVPVDDMHDPDLQVGKSGKNISIANTIS